MAPIDDHTPLDSTTLLTTDQPMGPAALIRFYSDLHTLLQRNTTLALITCGLDIAPNDERAQQVIQLMVERVQRYPMARSYRTDIASFVCVLPGIDRLQAAHVAETLRTEVEQAGDGITATFSVAGVPHDATDAGTLAAACEALLVYRSEGANRVYLVTPAVALTAAARLVTLLSVRISALIELNRQLDETKQQALHDPISGLPNSRALEQMLPRFLERGVRAGTPLALLLIDGDSLKEFNTCFGYEAGNEWIRCITRTLTGNLRPGDYVARWFVGDEFVVLLPETPHPQAMEVAERLRASVAAVGQAVAGFGSISIGVALAKADSSPTSLLAEAREALLLAKHRGKNRVASRDGAGATET